MNRSAWERAKSLLAEAAALPPRDRERFVMDRCPDPSLQRELLQLLESPAPLSSILAAGALEPGTCLGPYVVEHLLGRGGMGEVYQARDTVLNRRVAIKVLPAVFADDPDRLARFRREAQFLAALNHPNIAHVHGVVESAELSGLVMELVEGPTLAERLARERMPIDRVLDIARQLGAALAAAHEHGIIHRDLKPANIKLRDDGVVKVLDFGLGKSMTPTPPPGMDAVTAAAAHDATEPGVVLGTIAYMAPEQALGKPVDKRADIWAFGCVLYELVTGRQAFTSEVTSAEHARFLPDTSQWTGLPPETPASLRRVLRRCLQRDPQRRLRDIGDALIELEDPAEADVVHIRPAPGRPRRVAAILALVLTALAGVAVMSRVRSGVDVEGALPGGRFVMQIPSEAAIAGLDTPAVAISPDGTQVAFVGGSPVRRLYVRRIDEADVKPIPGSEGAASPFFSPDSRSIGFFAANGIHRASVDGGVPILVCTCGANNPRGGAWSSDGTIAFVPFPASGLRQVSVGGGGDRVMTTLDLKRGEGGHRWPEFVPGANAVAFVTGTATARTWDEGDIVVQSLATGERRTLLHGTYPRFSSSGHLLFVRAGALMAAPFDVKRLMVAGPPVRVVDGVMQSTFGAAQFSLSRTGSLVYVGGHVGQRELTWVTRSGELEPLQTPPRTYWTVRLSPDGRRLATGIENPGYDVWTYDVAGGGNSLDRLTSGGTHAWPIWSPDGLHVTFNSTQDSGVLNIFWKRLDGAGEERLTSSDHVQVPDSWSPDTRFLAYTESDPAGPFHIAVTDRESGRQVNIGGQTEFAEGGPMFSPDGRWLAYASNESGQYEVYVRPFNKAGEKQRVSAGGGTAPLWARSGRELFYRSGRRMMAVSVTPGSAFEHGAAHLLFEGPFLPAGQHVNYDVTADGERFVMILDRTADVRPTQIEIVLNSLDKLRQAALEKTR